jgi:hypothetical protein
MKTLKLSTGKLDIKIDSNKGSAAISSSMKAARIPANEQFNAAVDGLESLILAMHSSGVDISTEQHVGSFELAYESIINVYDVVEYDKEKTLVFIDRRVTAIVNESIEYEVNTADWEASLEENEGDFSLAFDSLCNAKETQRVSYLNDVDDITATHSVECNT